VSDYRKGMQKTRKGFFGRIADVFAKTTIDEDDWEELETLLLQADVGIQTTEKLIKQLRGRYKRDGMKTTEQLRQGLREELLALLREPHPMNISGRPLSVVLVVGVNGSGKTTTIGKLALRMKNNGRRVMVAAGDTFRAAAIEQLQKWGERTDVPVLAGLPNSDPGAVVFDAISAAKSRNFDVLIVDTAGRLQTKYNLMEELKKIHGVMAKVVPDAPHETLIVLDGTTGQNALLQAKGFGEAIKLTGAVVTKLDSTAKGGMVFAIQQETGLSVQYVGLGEGMYDLILFNPEQFVDGLLAEDEN
jgi:fused signal recognition particle receptor